MLSMNVKLQDLLNADRMKIFNHFQALEFTNQINESFLKDFDKEYSWKITHYFVKLDGAKLCDFDLASQTSYSLGSPSEFRGDIW